MTGRTISRRGMLKGLGLTAAGAILAACAPKAPAAESTAVAAVPATQAAATVPPPAAKPIKLSYWGHGYAGREAVVDAVVADFKAGNPGAEIALDSIPFDDFETKLATAFAAGTQPDIMSVGDWIIPAYVEKNLVTPLDPAAWGKGSEQEVIDLFEPGTMEGLRYNGKLWGYPMEVSVHAPAFRLDHYAALGADPNNPPDTYEDWLELGAKAVKRDDSGRMVQQWFEWYLGNPAYLFQIFGPALLGLGGDFLDKEATKGTLSSDAGIKALQFFSDTIHTLKLTDPGFTTDEPGGLFVAGRETYAWHNLPGARWVSTTFDNMTYGKDWKLQTMFKWRQGQRRNVFYSWGFVVTAKSSAKEEAWKFIEYMTRYSERTIQWVDKAGLVQTRKGWDGLDVIKDLPFTAFFLQEFRHSVTMPRTPRYNEVAIELKKQMGRLTATPPDPVQAVAADFDAAVNKILQSK